MATRTIASGASAWHGTLSPGTVETVVFSDFTDEVEVLSHDGQSAIWYTIDGTTPAVNGDKSHVIPAAAIGLERLKAPTSGQLTVKVLATATTFVTVRAA